VDRPVQCISGYAYIPPKFTTIVNPAASLHG
ncbi:uncharacterized protein METZ01_LOCUS173489, partial [marine metagenome]